MSKQAKKEVHKSIKYFHSIVAKISDLGIDDINELKELHPSLFEQYWVASFLFSDMALKSSRNFKRLFDYDHNGIFGLCHLWAEDMEDFRSDCVKQFCSESSFKHIIAQFNNNYHYNFEKETMCYTFKIHNTFEDIVVYIDPNAYYEDNQSGIFTAYITRIVNNLLIDKYRKYQIDLVQIDESKSKDSFDETDDNSNAVKEVYVVESIYKPLDSEEMSSELVNAIPSRTLTPEEHCISTMSILETFAELEKKAKSGNARQLFGLVAQATGYRPRDNNKLLEEHGVSMECLFDEVLKAYGEQEEFDISAYLGKYKASDFRLEESRASIKDNFSKWNSRGKENLAKIYPKYSRKSA